MGRAYEIGAIALETVFLKVQSKRDIFSNYVPDQTNITTAVHNASDHAPVAEKYPSGSYAHKMFVTKALIQNSRGQVPYMDDIRFRTQGSDSTIYIAFDFQYKEEWQIFRQTEVIDALGSLGGAGSLLGQIMGPLQPFLMLWFLLRFVAIIQEYVWEKDYRTEVRAYLTYALKCIDDCEEAAVKEEREEQPDMLVVQKAKSTSTLQDTREKQRRRRRLIKQYLLWLKREKLEAGEAIDNTVLINMMNEVTDTYL